MRHRSDQNRPSAAQRPGVRARASLLLWFGVHPARSCFLVAAAALAAACAPRQPPRWAEGGAPLAFGLARWEHDGDTVEIQPDGRVLVDGDLRFVLDRVGRVADDDYEPYAVLLPDGQLAGVDSYSLGRLGVTNASPPGSVEAWLAVMPNGQVVYFSSDGDRASGGVWQGCSGPILRTCTLVTHLLAVASYPGPNSGVSVGVGIGVGVGY